MDPFDLIGKRIQDLSAVYDDDGPSSTVLESRPMFNNGGMLVKPSDDGSRPGYAKVKKSVGQPKQYNLEKIEEAILKANQGDKYISYEDIGKKLNLESPGRISGIVRREGITPLDSYKIKVEKAYIKLFSDFDRNATELTKPLHRIKEMIGGYKYRKNANPNRSRVEDISNALKSSKVLNWDEEVKPIINKLSSANFLKNINKDWTLGDVQNSLQTKSMLRTPKDDAQRLMDYAVRNQIMSKGDTEFSIYNKNNLNKRITDFSQVDSYYDLAFKDGSGKVYDMDYIKTKGRSDPLFQEYFKLQDELSGMKNRTTWPDGSDIIDPKTGKKTTFGNYSGQMYKFGYGYKKPFSRFPYEIDHNDGVAKNPFKNLSILPQRVNVALGAATRLDKPEIASKIGKDYFRNLPIDDLLMQEKNLGSKILIFDKKGEHVGKNLKPSYTAAKDEINRKTEQAILQNIQSYSKLPQCKVGAADGGRIGFAFSDECIRDGLKEQKIQAQKGNKKAAQELVQVGKVATRAGLLKNILGPGAILSEVVLEGAIIGNKVLGGKPGDIAWAESYLSYLDPRKYRGELDPLKMKREDMTTREIEDADGNIKTIDGPNANILRSGFAAQDQLSAFNEALQDRDLAKARGRIDQYNPAAADAREQGRFADQSADIISSEAFKDASNMAQEYIQAQEGQRMFPYNQFKQSIGRFESGEDRDYRRRKEQEMKNLYTQFSDTQLMDLLENSQSLKSAGITPEQYMSLLGAGTKNITPAVTRTLSGLDAVRTDIQEQEALNRIAEAGGVANLAGGGIAKIAGDRSGAMTTSMNPDSQGLSYLFNRVKKVQE
jgi:hypothetical protein